ncbi:uncharacterized protein HKW66_Vig0162480 [Vigna angularis]|uniref:Putative plant transposon protein domain-containing protein n=1 Tax=Phaseolus angularis TaxID=3914 RepID=A0A8T0JI11_PHAAN|nr:uncharacterized protein HKW66_Vig0162480 [Vigna angularis]
MADRAQKKMRASSFTRGPPNRPPPSPPLSPPLTSNELFSNDDQYERFSTHFFERPILQGKYVDVDFFGDGTFEFFDILTKAGLIDFVAYRRHYYPELVRVFYSNMRVSDSGVIRTEVKKVKITIKPSLFHKLTSIPSVGARFEGNLVDEWKDEYNSVSARQLICKPGSNIQGRILAGTMKFQTRILHYVLCRILVPRSTNVAQATEEDIMLLWALMNSVQINWGHLIRNRMKRATRDNAQLPYPHLITTFMEHFGVPTETDPFTQVKNKQRIGLEVLSSFGYHKTHEGIWVPKVDVGNIQEQVGIEEDVEVGNEEHEVRQPSVNPQPTSSQTLTEVINQIQELRTFVGDRFDTIENRVRVLHEEVIQLRNQLERQPPA